MQAANPIGAGRACCTRRGAAARCLWCRYGERQLTTLCVLLLMTSTRSAPGSSTTSPMRSTTARHTRSVHCATESADRVPHSVLAQGAHCLLGMSRWLMRRSADGVVAVVRKVACSTSARLFGQIAAASLGGRNA